MDKIVLNYVFFTAHLIDLDAMKLLTEGDIIKMIPYIGIQRKLWHKLKSWQRACLVKILLTFNTQF